MACFSLQWLFARKRGGLLGSSVPPTAPSTLKNWVAALARVRETRVLANAATLNPRLDRALLLGDRLVQVQNDTGRGGVGRQLRRVELVVDRTVALLNEAPC